MGKLQRGKLYISKEDIISKLGLTEDTIINPKVGMNGDIEIEVIASSENKHGWLTDNNNSDWNLRRIKLHVSEKEEREPMFITGGYIFSNEGIKALNANEIILNNKETEDLMKVVNISSTNVNNEDIDKLVKSVFEKLKRDRSWKKSE